MPVKINEIEFSPENREIVDAHVNKLVDNYFTVGVDSESHPIICTCLQQDWSAVQQGNHKPLVIRVSFDDASSGQVGGWLLNYRQQG